MFPAVCAKTVEILYAKPVNVDRSIGWVIALSDDDALMLIRRVEAKKLSYFVVASQDSLADWLGDRELTYALASQYADELNSGIKKMYGG